MMKKSLELLKAHGCSIDKAYARCVCDENFLLDCIEKSLCDPSFEKLGEAIKEKNADNIFYHAHNLKGALANVGLDPLCKINDCIVEPSRNGATEGFDLYYKELLEEVKTIKAIIEEQ